MRIDIPSFLAGSAMVAIAANFGVVIGAGQAASDWIASQSDLGGWLQLASAGALGAGALAAARIGDPLRRRMSLAPGRGTTDFAALQREAFPFAEAGTGVERPMTVVEWLTSATGRGAGWSDDEIRTALERQLTTRFTGIEGERPPRAAVIALLALACDADASPGERVRFAEARNALARAFAADRPAEEAARERRQVQTRMSAAIAASDRSKAAISAAVQGHAFTETVAMSLLAAARARRHLGCAEFGWLQRIDRPLFMALNSVGRPSALPEGLGAAAHFASEVAAGRRLDEKAVGTAVMAVRGEGWLETAGSGA